MAPEESLRRHPLFALLSADEMARWLASSAEATVPTGDTIFQQGTPGTWTYLVLDGKVPVVRTTAADRDISLGTLSTGEVFSEYALLRTGLNTATCRAAAVSRLPLPPLTQFLQDHPEVRGNLKNWLRLHALLRYLRGQSFRGFLSAPSALRFLDRLRPVVFPADRIVQAPGLGDDRWSFIESGRVRLEPADGQSPATACELGPGDCFGAATLLTRPEAAVAVSLTEVRCLSLWRQHFAPPPVKSPDTTLQTLTGPPPAWSRPYVWVGQQEAADCGVAALAMVARFHGLDMPVELLRRQIELRNCGANLAELQRLAAVLGLRGVPVRVGGEQLGQVALPAIAHMEDGHYVVLYAFSGTGVVIGDPAAGLVRMTQELFTRTCSGHLLLLSTGVSDSGDGFCDGLGT